MGSRVKRSFRVVYEPTGAELDAAMALRYRVFVEEQDVAIELERDELDESAHHVVLMVEGGQALATGRVLVRGPVGKIQRVAVDRTERGGGYGREVMKHLEICARAHGASTARLASQVEAVAFYERLGYAAFGDLFIDAGILHRWMEKPLEPSGTNTNQAT